MNPAPAPAATVELRKAVFSAFMGTVIEWYDFFLYGTAASLVFPQLFFPSFSHLAGTMASFGTYAVGFFARPVGGVLFGYIGDKFGRKVTLIWTLSMMGGATFLIGCLPTYASVGNLAPILLVLLRFFQGLAIGGEWGGAALMAVEHGHKGRRGWYASWAQVGVPAGLLLANGIFSLNSSGQGEFFLHWGWRICFWFGILLTGLGLFIREQVSETPLFRNAQSAGIVTRNPLLGVLRLQWREVLLVIGVKMAENAGFYILSVYVLSYVTQQVHGSTTSIVYPLLVAAMVEIVSIPLFGILSDRVGRRKVLLFGTLLFTVGIFPFFAALRSGDATYTYIAMILALGVVHGAMYAPQASFFPEMFATNVRYSGASFGYSVATPLSGGLAPLVATYLVKVNGGDPWLCAGYLAALGVLSCVCIVIAKETHLKNISE